MLKSRVESRQSKATQRHHASEEASRPGCPLSLSLSSEMSETDGGSDLSTTRERNRWDQTKSVRAFERTVL